MLHADLDYNTTRNGQSASTVYALPSDPNSLKNLAQFSANTSVASSVASGNGVPASALLRASAYGSRHHELTLICASVP